jgi:hypothetical protein
MRWAGSARYDLGAFAAIAACRKYQGRLRYIPSDADASDTGDTDNNDANDIMSPCSKTACLRCNGSSPNWSEHRSFALAKLSAANKKRVAEEDDRKAKKKRHGKHSGKAGKASTSKGSKTENDEGDGKGSRKGKKTEKGDSGDDEVSDNGDRPFFELNEDVVGLSDEYVHSMDLETVEGGFLFFAASKLTHIATDLMVGDSCVVVYVVWCVSDSPVQSHPFAHAGDGYLDLAFMHPSRPAGRMKLLKAFENMEDGSCMLSRPPFFFVEEKRGFALLTLTWQIRTTPTSRTKKPQAFFSNPAARSAVGGKTSPHRVT